MGHEENDSNNIEAFPSSEMNVAVRDLTDIIWKEGGFRYKHTGTNFQSSTYGYHCSQDLAHSKATSGLKNWINSGMVDVCSDSYAKVSLAYAHVYKIGPGLSQSVINGIRRTKISSCSQ